MNVWRDEPIPVRAPLAVTAGDVVALVVEQLEATGSPVVLTPGVLPEALRVAQTLLSCLDNHKH